MGIIIGKFMKKKNTYEILEKLDNDIKEIEEYGRSTEQTRKRIVARFIMIAILTYLSIGFLLYFYYDDISDNKLIIFIPFVAFPFIIFLVKRLLTWYYTRKLRKNQNKLEKYTSEKKKILENVMENETYKVAKKILERFGNEKIQAMPIEIMKSKSQGVTPKPQTAVVTSAVRQRVAAATRLDAPVPKRLSFGEQSVASNSSYTHTPRQMVRPLPRPMLKKERTILDKLIDYLVDDGPSNRYALICKRCNGHNGAAHKNEFDYLSYDCSYCLYHNPAPKKRSIAPPIENPPVRIVSAPSSSDSSDSDSEEAAQNTADSTSSVLTHNNANSDVEQTSNQQVTDNLNVEPSPANTPEENAS